MPEKLSALEALIKRLQGRKDVSVARTADGVTITPTEYETFVIVLGDDHRVSFDGWHARFDSEDAALRCVVWGLSPACRLEVWMRGQTPVRWMTQALRANQWVDGSVTSKTFTPFWRRKSLVYKQNRIFDLIEGVGADSP